MTDKATTPALTIVHADEASWEELQAVLGTRPVAGLEAEAGECRLWSVLGLSG